MNGNFLNILGDMFCYILNIKLHEIMLHIFYVIVFILIAYVAESIIVGLPIMIWEAVTKKKLPFDSKEKVAFIVTAVFTVALILIFLYQEVT